MARSSSRKRRVTFDNARRSLPLSDNYRPVKRVALEDLRSYEDRRSWHPESNPSPRSSRRSDVRLVARSTPVRKLHARGSVSGFTVPELWSSVPIRVGFQRPEGVSICMRRQVRKEVLHARRKTGKVGQRRPRWNFWSSVSCKRRRK